MTALPSVLARHHHVVARRVASSGWQSRPPQRRGFLNWATNYPDRINELKKIHQAGGRSTPTWLKQPGDKGMFLFGVGLVTVGIAQLIPGFYRLATGKGKLEYKAENVPD